MPFLKRHFIVVLFASAVFGCVGMAIYQLANRIPYKWDMFVWSESTFLTNLLKIDAGMPVYTSPEQVNSFVYSPGLEFITYALLKPINKHLDIRACRVISVGFAVLASLAFMRCSILLAREVSPRPLGRWFAPLSAAILFLVIYHNFTSDVPHPDNLHICHLAVTMMLTFEAIRRPSAKGAVFAILFASLGVLVKQTAAMSAVGATIALVLAAPRKVRTASWLVPLAAFASMASLACLWSIGQAKFYTFDVLSSHGILNERILILFTFLFQEYRLLPIGLLAVAAIQGFRSANPTLKQFLIAHVLLGIFEAAPAISAFLKPMGNWNNLAVIEVWATVPGLPLLLSFLRKGATDGAEPIRSNPFHLMAKATVIVLAFCMVYFYQPTKDTPLKSHYNYCRRIDKMVAEDLKAGKRVLVAHGTEFLIRNKATQVPFDRSNSFLELTVAGKGNLTGTEKRIREHYYDKIYLNSHWYPPELHLIMLANYREVARIPAPIDRISRTKWDPYMIRFGFQRLHLETPVYEPREFSTIAKGEPSAIRQ